MTDNFKLIKEFIQLQWDGQFDSFTDAFYTVEIISRSKDNTNTKSHKFKAYYITNMSDFDKYENEIKLLCDALQARAYVSVNAKSWHKITLNTMAEYANRIAQDNFDKPYSVFDSCAAKYVERVNQLWIVDVDKEDADKYNLSVDDLVDNYINVIESCKPKKKIITVIPTKTGKHIITHPFNTAEFIMELMNLTSCNKTDKITSIDDIIKKNNNTLLYENIK